MFQKQAICLLLPLLASCSLTHSNPGRVAIDLNHTTVDSIPLSYYVDSISYIDLEDNDDCLLSYIDCAQISDSSILILDKDNKTVALFDRTGAFKRRIGSRGQGPGEYVKPHDIDLYNDTIYIYDEYLDGALKYDLYGNFIAKDSIGYFDDVALIKDGSGRYLSVGYNMPEKYTGIFIVSQNPYRKVQIGSCSDISVRSNTRSEIYRDGKQLFVTGRAWDDRVMKLDCDSMATVFNPIVYPQYTQTDADNWEGGYEACFKHFYRTSFRTSGRWLQYFFWKMDNPRFVVCDLADKSVVIGEDVYNDIDENTSWGFLPEAHDGAMLANTHRNERGNPSIMFLHLKK